MVVVEAIKLDGGALGALATSTPSIQWVLSGDEINWKQKRYEAEATFGNGQTETFSQETDESIHVLWPFRALQSRETIALRVRVFGQDGTESQWSDQAHMRVGVLDNEWSAPFIAQMGQRIDSHEEKVSPEILFRSPKFAVSKKVNSATIYSTALGVYDLEINGNSVSSTVLAPGWTSYGRSAACDTGLRAFQSTGRSGVRAFRTTGPSGVPKNGRSGVQAFGRSTYSPGFGCLLGV